MKDHPALVAALLAAALVAGRLLAIARFDINTAATILQVSGTGTAVTGTALSLLPFALVGTTCLLALKVFVDQSFLTLPVSAELLFSCSVAALVCLATIGLVLATALFTLVAIAMGRFIRRRGYEARITRIVAGSRVLRIQAIILAAAATVAPIVLQRPWLPIQALSLKDGSVVVGYVLGEAEGQVAVMDDRDRTVRLFDPTEIDERTICSGPAETGGLLGNVPQISLKGSALGFLLWGDDVPNYPACPK